MRLIYGLDDAVAAWVAARIPNVGSAEGFGLYVAIGVVDEGGRPVGGVVWHGYKPDYRSIELSAAADTPRWLTRRIVAEIFSYPFLFANCRRVTTLTPARNAKALKVNRRLGFQVEGLVRHGFGNDDMVVMGLLREEWLAGRWSPRETDTAAKMPPDGAPVAQMEMH